MSTYGLQRPRLSWKVSSKPLGSFWSLLLVIQSLSRRLARLRKLPIASSFVPPE